MTDVSNIKLGVDSTEVGKARQEADKLGVSVNKVAGLAKGLAAAFAAKQVFDFFRAGVKSANEFESAVAEVHTLLGKTAPIDKYASAAEKMALTFGGTAKSQMEALYDVVSAGNSDIESASKVLEQANKLAVAGVTEVGVAVDGLTSVLNAYGKEASEAEAVSDVMFTAVRLGKTTVDELAGAVGKIAPLAAAMGVSFEEVGAALAVTTSKGINTSESVSGLKAAFSNILKPTAEARDLANELGLAFNGQALEAKGLVPFLQDVMDKTGGNTTTMGKLFGSVEGLNTVLALTDGELQAVSAALEQTSNAGGATADAMELVGQTSAKSAERAAAAWDTFMRTVGGANAVVQTHKSFLDEAADSLNRLSGALGNAAAQEAFLSSEVRDAQTALDDTRASIVETEASLAEYGERTIWNARQIQDHEDTLAKLNKELVENEDALLAAKDELNEFTGATGQADQAAADFVGPLQQVVEETKALGTSADDSARLLATMEEATSEAAIEARNLAKAEAEAEQAAIDHTIAIESGIGAARVMGTTIKALSAEEAILKEQVSRANEAINEQSEKSKLAGDSKRLLALMAEGAMTKEEALAAAAFDANEAMRQQAEQMGLTKEEMAALGIELEETETSTRKVETAQKSLRDVIRDAKTDWDNLADVLGIADTKLGKTVSTVLGSIQAFQTAVDSVQGLADSFSTLVGWADKFLNMDFGGIAGGFGSGTSILPGGGGGGGGGGIGGGMMAMDPMTAAIVGGISGLVSGLITGGYDGPGVDEEHEHQRLTAQTSINEIQEMQALHHQLRVVLQEINIERRGNFAELTRAIKSIEIASSGSKEAVKESTVQITAASKENTKEVVEKTQSTSDDIKSTTIDTSQASTAEIKETVTEASVKASEEGSTWNQELINNIDISSAKMHIKQGDIEQAIKIVGEEEVERLTALIEQEKTNAELVAEANKEVVTLAKDENTEVTRETTEAVIAAEAEGTEILRAAEEENTQIIKEAEEAAAQLISEVETENTDRLEAAQKEGTEVVAEVTKENAQRMIEAQAEVAAIADSTAKETAANLEAAEIRAAELVANAGAQGDKEIVGAVVSSAQATANAVSSAVSGVVSKVNNLANDVASYKKRYDEEQASSRASTQSASGDTVFDIFANMDDEYYDEEMSDADLAKKIARLRNTVGTHDAYYADNVDSVTKERVGPSLSQRLNYRELEKLEQEAEARKLSEELIAEEEQKVIDRDATNTERFADLNYDEADYDDKIASRNRAIARRERQLSEEELENDVAYQKLVAELAVLEEGKASLDVGTDYVPRDMLAQIHKGEMVFSPSQSDDLREAVIGAASGGGGVNAYIMGELQEQTNLMQRFVDLVERWDGDGLPEVRAT